MPWKGTSQERKHMAMNLCIKVFSCNRVVHMSMKTPGGKGCDENSCVCLDSASGLEGQDSHTWGQVFLRVCGIDLCQALLIQIRRKNHGAILTETPTTDRKSVAKEKLCCTNGSLRSQGRKLGFCGGRGATPASIEQHTAIGSTRTLTRETFNYAKAICRGPGKGVRHTLGKPSPQASPRPCNDSLD